MKVRLPPADRSLELTASAIAIASILMGSTSLIGAVIGLVAGIPWWTLMIRRRMWGLLPGNIAGTAAYVFNVWKAFPS